jgi:hypothetical protein
MTKGWLIFWLIIVAACASLFMSIATSPARAQSICYTQAQLEQDAKAKGRKIVGGASYDGAETDSAVVVQTNTDILIYGFRDGCYVGFTQLEPVAHPAKGEGA